MRVEARSTYDRLAEFYDGLFKRPRDLAENTEILRRMNKAGVGGRVLDVGCGTGFFLELRRNSPSKYLGIDVSEEMLKVARAKFPEHSFELRDVRDLDVEEGSYDSVVALWSFPYVKDHASAVAKMLRALRPGGVVFLAVYSQWTAKNSPLPYETWPGYSFAERTMFSPASLSSLFPGLADVRIQGMSARFIPERIGARFMRLESETVGRLCPCYCRYLTFSARKYA